MSKDMNCPYCDEWFEFCDDEPQGEDVVEEVECPECEKQFVFHRIYFTEYATSKADCLNGAAHDFQQVTRCPAVIGKKTRWRCTMCSKEEDRPSKCQHEGYACWECKE